MFDCRFCSSIFWYCIAYYERISNAFSLIYLAITELLTYSLEARYMHYGRKLLKMVHFIQVCVTTQKIFLLKINKRWNRNSICIKWIFYYKQIAYLWAYNLAKWLKSITLFEASFMVVFPFRCSTEDLSFEVI